MDEHHCTTGLTRGRACGGKTLKIAVLDAINLDEFAT